MTLADLMKIEEIDDYFVLWYGVEFVDMFLSDEGLKKETIELSKGVDKEFNRVFIILAGINGKKSKYKYAIRLTGKTEDGLYTWERVPLSLDQYCNRLIFKCKRQFSYYNSKNVAGDFNVDQIISVDENRTVETFKDYESVELTYNELKEIVENEYSDYYIPFKSIKAVYMIIDGNTGRQYVGSAYGEKEGLWARWSTYAYTYHGNNLQLKQLYEENGGKYFDKFKYVILKIFPMGISDVEVIDSESRYKERFMTREFGLNSN